MLAMVFGIVLFAQGVGNEIITPPTSVNVQNHITVSAPPPDPQAIAEASVQSTNAIILQVAAPIPVDWDNQMFNLPDLWRQTPSGLTYDNPEIRRLSDFVKLVAVSLLALAIAVYGMRLALAQDIDGWKRLVWGTILSIGDLIWWEWGIRLNNAINDAIGAPDLPSLVRPHIAFDVHNVGQQAGNTVLVIVYAIVALLVMISLLFRLGLIQVLICIGPLALFCAATEQSEHFMRRYVSLSVGLLFSQIMVVLGMKVAQVDATVGTGVAGTFMALVVLLLLRRLPALVASTSSSGGDWGVQRVAVMVGRRLVGAFR